MTSGSNEHWGQLAEADSELAEAWDRCDPLPEAGINDALDAFAASKRIDIPALVRVGARLAGPTTLCFAFPDGLKYRDVETGRRWTYAGSTFDDLKVIAASRPEGSVALVVESETDAARCTLLFPGCAVALLPAGARHFGDRFAEQLKPYDQVLVALDNDEAGDAGAAKVTAAVPQAQRFAPPEGHKDWCEVDAAPPLPAAGDAPFPIIFTDLAGLLRAGVPDPEVLVDDLLYTEGVHLFSGHPGCGKTTLVMAIARDVMADKHRHVVLLDYESGLRQTARRLQSMDFPADLVDERLHYAEWPERPEEHFAAVNARWPGALVIIDSLSKALSQHGINENDNTEVTAWTTPLVKACKNNALPVIVIDHIAKDGDKSDYSRGAGAKLSDVDVHRRVVKDAEFNRSIIGGISTRHIKDREGFFALSTHWIVGDGQGKLTLTPCDAPVEAEGIVEDANAPAI